VVARRTAHREPTISHAGWLPAGLSLLVASGSSGGSATMPSPSTAAPVRVAVVTYTAGHGFAGMHSAADTYHEAPAYLNILATEFLTHGAESTVDAPVETPSHPASALLGARFTIFDEIYRFARQNRGAVTMLLSRDRHPTNGLPGARFSSTRCRSRATKYGRSNSRSIDSSGFLMH
jgi:Trehalose utilisation